MTRLNDELRRKVDKLALEIDGDIQHGECFYDKPMLEAFLRNLKRMGDLAVKYYESNVEDMEDEEE